MDDSSQTHLLAEIGVVFLLFTLGLEFSWPRMVAMRREVFGLGLAADVAHDRRVRAIGMLLGLSVAGGAGGGRRAVDVPPPPS